MIVDSSALLAILFREPGYGAFLDHLESAAAAKVSAATVLEASIVMQVRLGPKGVEALHALLHAMGVEEVAFTPEQRREAERAFVLYGKGSGHGARLNYGDCMTYGLAKSTGLPLLFKGEDFAQTDLDLVDIGTRR